MQEIWVQFLGQEDPLEKGMATHSSILACRIPWTEEPGGLHSSWGHKRVGHDWATNTHTRRYKHGDLQNRSLSMTEISDYRRAGERGLRWWSIFYTLLRITNFIFLGKASVQFSSVAQSCPTLRPHESQHARPPCPSLPEFTQTHVHWVGDAIRPSHPLSSPSLPAPNPSQHQSLFQWS